MAIQTTGDLIASTLKSSGIVGVGQTPLAEDANDALDLLIETIETWKRERFLAYHSAELIIPSTGAVSYAMPDRPPRVDSAYMRLLVGQPQAGITTAGLLDIPLGIIDTQAEYNQISLKSMEGFPSAVWYAPDYPTGTLWFWPIPRAGQFEMHVFYQYPLPSYSSLTDPLALPPEYVRMLRYELSVQLQMNYGQAPNKGHVALLVGLKAAIKASNARVSSLAMPPGLATRGAGTGGISGAVGPHQSVIVLDSGLPVLG